ncbi:hypothetical protein [Priestia taiwanensis]|uniref:Uncharacterized protein n=1 Tax=Priestia taiwanensis TaxID=1347902 RepID=A0A917AW41_9BACI|nr:hypothetical protein [Priestia taiwanensis]MBM7364425.1 uncharacterized protein YhbP (UPF0306 family) [Priestia taiwanensis]GGE81552.1 hypothetical protein GCM10007140_33940 [Priestia taiwanensis]
MEIKHKIEETLRKTDARLLKCTESTNNTYTVTIHFKEEEHEVAFRIYEAAGTKHVELESHQDITIARFVREHLEQSLNQAV